MKSVTVQKESLGNTLRENMETHVADFEIAWDAFKEMAIHNFQQRLKQLKDLKRGQQIDLWVNLTIPENHEDDYKRAIEMLEWEVGDTVQLTESEFQQLVQDNWHWKQQHLMSNMMYTGSASPSKVQ